ncbi:hypothetical protein CEUSTIGMA_g1307.t1 [Chlamydomonas eustigma]|uniref:tubulin-glutamate carboxypeptidase n=1 Tax=Chlamydomonas eustigma TaxID=1157962 RepID=A0A250WSP1_9CHLO|nr:hypothetical protein CEUSTIGMA_g1307.t1 [Chlamydomonas eustigma]|eukprot:GAX73857.1 hypothetical protein CEUSTIGMA_g1307.t1 [Chlamydomonas eustigma]
MAPASSEDEQHLISIRVPKSDPNRTGSTSWKVHKFTFRADFDSANLYDVHEGCNSMEVLLWTRRDCHSTPFERPTRTWFYYGVSGGKAGDVIMMTMMNLNKQGKLYSQDYRPWYWTNGEPEWRMAESKCMYKRDGEDFQLRFSHRFDSPQEVFFAFAIPFSYRDTQTMLSRIQVAHEDNQSLPAAEVTDDTPSLKGKVSRQTRLDTLDSRIYFRKQLLARSIEGRRVDVITITDCYGASGFQETLPEGVMTEEQEEQEREDAEEKEDRGDISEEEEALVQKRLLGPSALFRGKKVFFVSARVHPGETPSSHMFNGLLALLLRQHDPRAAALRRAFVFKLVPLVNPDGVYHGCYRTDTRGQNLNRYYLGSPDKDYQPSVWAIKQLLLYYAHHPMQKLEYYIDLHAHANKKGVFVYGNAHNGEEQLMSLLYSRLVALNHPAFDFLACNFTERNMSRPDKDGESKEGAGRVALFRETGLLHLYTVESNYNTVRESGIVPACSGESNGRASPPSGKRAPQRLTTGVLQGVGRALALAALDLKGTNPWSRLPASEYRSLEGMREWLITCLRSGQATRVNVLPYMDEQSVVSILEELPFMHFSRRLIAAASRRAPVVQGGWAPPPPKPFKIVWTPSAAASTKGAAVGTPEDSGRLPRTPTLPPIMRSQSTKESALGSGSQQAAGSSSSAAAAAVRVLRPSGSTSLKSRSSSATFGLGRTTASGHNSAPSSTVRLRQQSPTTSASTTSSAPKTAPTVSKLVKQRSANASAAQSKAAFGCESSPSQISMLREEAVDEVEKDEHNQPFWPRVKRECPADGVAVPTVASKDVLSAFRGMAENGSESDEDDNNELNGMQDGWH